MRRIFITVLLVMLAFSSAFAGVHRRQHLEHRHQKLAPVWEDDVPEPLPERAKAGPYLLGYFPYWSTNLDAVRFDLLDEVAYFGADVSAEGELSATFGWPRQDLVAAAHAENCAVSLTLVLFSPADQRTLLSEPVFRDLLVENTVDAVLAAGADGVNVDFELLPYDQKENFTIFVHDLFAALAAVIENPVLSVATPAVDWAGSFDYDRLAEVARLFVMAYDYHWSTSDPGPVAPVYGSQFWGAYAYDWTILDYATFIEPYGLDRVILGLPLYGYEWPIVEPDLPATATGTATARTFLQARAYADQYGYTWDGPSNTPYITYQDGQWRQFWYEDIDSLTDKLDFAGEVAVGGVGFWTIAYADDDQAFWSLVATFKNQSWPDDDAVDPDEDDGGGSGLSGCGC